MSHVIIYAWTVTVVASVMNYFICGKFYKVGV